MTRQEKLQRFCVILQKKCDCVDETSNTSGHFLTRKNATATIIGARKVKKLECLAVAAFRAPLLPVYLLAILPFKWLRVLQIPLTSCRIWRNLILQYAAISFQ